MKTLRRAVFEKDNFEILSDELISKNTIMWVDNDYRNFNNTLIYQLEEGGLYTTKNPDEKLMHSTNKIYILKQNIAVTSIKDNSTNTYKFKIKNLETGVEMISEKSSTKYIVYAENTKMPNIDIMDSSTLNGKASRVTLDAFINAYFPNFKSTRVTAVQTKKDHNAYAEKLKEIGVFVGTSKGFELDRKPARLEGMIMLIRLLGIKVTQRPVV